MHFGNYDFGSQSIPQFPSTNTKLEGENSISQNFGVIVLIFSV